MEHNNQSYDFNDQYSNNSNIRNISTIPKPTFSGTLDSNEKRSNNHRDTVPSINHADEYQPPQQYYQGFSQNINRTAYFPQQTQFQYQYQYHYNSQNSNNFMPTQPQPFINSSMNLVHPVQVSQASQWNEPVVSQTEISSNVNNTYDSAYRSLQSNQFNYQDSSKNKDLNENSTTFTNDVKKRKLDLEVQKDDSDTKTNKAKRTHISPNVNKEGEDLDSDEEMIRNKNEPVSVPGTSITLVTDEDIAKWREERRKMWLIKISNNRKSHMDSMGIKEEEVNKTSVLREAKKDKQFIQSIQNQVNRFNPKSNLNTKIYQREMAGDNAKLLNFIEELGDCGLLEYELNQEEKNKLFRNNIDGDRREGRRYNNNNNNNINNNGGNTNNKDRGKLKNKRNYTNSRFNDKRGNGENSTQDKKSTNTSGNLS